MYLTQTRSRYKLKVKDLMPYINDLKDSGFQIAGYLDLTTNWASIEKTKSDPADRLVTLLDTWLNDTEVETCPHTWDYFIHIVRKLRKGQLADKMAKELSKIRHFQVSTYNVWVEEMSSVCDCKEHAHSLVEKERYNFIIWDGSRNII